MANIKLTTFSKSLDMNISINVILPDKVKNFNETSIIYLLHGYNGHYEDWLRFTSIERYVRDKNIALVLPSINNSFYTNMKYGPNYFSYLTDELPEIVSKYFSLNTIRENSNIIGLSMGGYGALKAALTYPNKYSSVVSISGVVKLDTILDSTNSLIRTKILKGIYGESLNYSSENNLLELLKNVNSNKLNITITCGNKDFLYKDNIKFVNHLENQNINHKSYYSKGSHNWEYWDSTIKKIIKENY